MSTSVAVQVPEWNASVLVQGLTLADAETFEGEGRRVDLQNIRAKVAARCILGLDGTRIFSDADAELLGRKSSVAIDHIFNVALRLSGIWGEESDDDLFTGRAVPSFLRSMLDLLRYLERSVAQKTALGTGLTFARALGVVADPEQPDKERLENAEYLVEQDFARPIAPQRWCGIAGALRDALHEEGLENEAHKPEQSPTAPEERLREITIGSLLLAAGGSFGDTPLGKIRDTVRTRLNDEVTQALLGPDWRHKERKAPHVRLPEDPPDTVCPPALQVWPESQIEARLEVDLLLARARLTSLEREAILAKYRDPPEKSKVTAVRLHSTVGAVYQARHRAKEKIRAAAIP